MNILSAMAGEHEVYYSCPDGDGIKRAGELGLGTIVCNTRSPGDIKRVVKEYKPDAIHAHDPAVGLTCALAGVKFVSHLHSNCSWLSRICPNSLGLLFACMRAKKVICVSESIINEYVFGGYMRRKAVVIPNVVDGSAVARMANAPCDESYDISFVGRLIADKDPVRFIRVIKAVKETLPYVKAVMIGDGDVRGEVEKTISELGLSDNIILKGFDINPHKYVKNSRVGALTSKFEGFGLVAVEAMTQGKPFVAFPAGGLVNIINNENGKLCASEEDMAKEIVALLSDSEYYNKKSEAAQKSATAFTDIKAYVDTIIDIYKK